MSALFLFSVLLLCCSAASRSHDFTLCSKLAHWLDVIPMPSKYISTQESLTYLHSLPCLNLYFNRKLLPIPRSTPTFKLALILLLAGDVSLNLGLWSGPTFAPPLTFVPFVRKLPDIIISKTIDILAVTETWLRLHDTASCIADISPPGYVFHHKPRPVGRGGGVGFLVSKQFKVNLQHSPNYTTFESMDLNISNSCFSGHFICIYRPPGHPANFFEQFQDLLENVVTIHSDCYIVGDFNLHLDIPSATTTTFNDILASFDTTCKYPNTHTWPLARHHNNSLLLQKHPDTHSCRWLI